MSKTKHPSLFIRNHPTAPQLCPELAKEIGLNESILLLQWEYWMRTEGQVRDGDFWLRKPVREIQDFFPFWGVGTVHRTLQSLVKQGLLIFGDYDDTPGRGAGWFRLNVDGLSRLRSIRVDCSTLEQRMFQKDEKSFQSGATVLNINKDKDIYTPSGYRVPKKPAEPRTIHPPEDFKLTEWMRVYFAERFVEFSDDEIPGLLDAWKRARHADSDKRRTLEQWQYDCLRYLCTTWEKRSRNGHNGNGHGEVVNDQPMKTIKERMRLGLL